jgi:pyruvate dehydrogenase E2 component (dihydrolipoamide acetyltransferase)
MARSFKLPDLGEGIHEGEVLKVLVNVGDQVAEDQPILVVETDKAAVEIPSPFSGAVQAIRVQAGDLVRVGDELIVFGDGEGPEEVEPAPAVKPAARPIKMARCRLLRRRAGWRESWVSICARCVEPGRPGW